VVKTLSTNIYNETYPGWFVVDLRRAILASRCGWDVSDSIWLECFSRSSYIFAANTLAFDCLSIPSEPTAFTGPPMVGLLLPPRCNWAWCISWKCCICSCCCSFVLLCCAYLSIPQVQLKTIKTRSIFNREVYNTH